ncbi:MAG: helix-turn-helix domain-containing protein, partial [Candidatus Hodarchaeota archaeon]
MSEKVLTESITVLKNNLGVTNVEAKVIIPIFLGGNMTAGGIAVVAKEPISKVERALGRLEKKGLVMRIDGVVPIYRVVPTVLAVGQTLTSIVDDLSKYSESSEAVFAVSFEGIDTAIESVLDSHKNTFDDSKMAFQEYEQASLQTIQVQVEAVASLASQLMNEFVSSIKNSLSTSELSLDDNLGNRLATLQTELDKTQKELNRVLSASFREFSKSLTAEQNASKRSAKEIRTRTSQLVESVRNAIQTALTESRDALINTTAQMALDINTKSIDASDKAIATLGAVSDDLDAAILHLDNELGAIYLSSDESLKDLINYCKEKTIEEADLARARIEEAIEISNNMVSNVESWKKEVGTFAEVGVQSLESQLSQMQSTETNYLDTVKSTTSGYLDKSRLLISEEYEKLVELALNLHTDFENNLLKSRESTLKLLDKQFKGHEKKLGVSNEAMKSEIDIWSQNATKAISGRLNSAEKEVNQILETESSEVDALVESIGSRLKYAFNTNVSY